MNFFLKLTVALLIAAASAQHIPTGTERQEVLDAHNNARREMAVQYQVANMGELVWSDAAAQHGLNWLNQQNCMSGGLQHSNSYAAGFGENLARGQRSWTAAAYDAWYASELSCYEAVHPDWGRCSCTCGHMTAMTWAATTVVGCARCNSTNAYICNYGSAAPNFSGQRVFDAGTGAPCSNCPSSMPNCNDNLCTAGAGGQTNATTTTRAATTTTRAATTTTRAATTTTRAATTTSRAATTTSRGATTTQATRPPVETTTSPEITTNPPETRPPTETAEPDMVVEFTLRSPRYSQINAGNEDALKDSLKSQLTQIYGWPFDRMSVEFRRGNRGAAIAVVTVAGAQSADEPRAATMVEAAMDNEAALEEFEEVACTTCGSPQALNTSQGGSSTALLAGIAVAVIVVLIAAGVGAYFFLKKRKEKLYLDNMSSDTQMTAGGEVNRPGNSARMMYA